MFSPTLNAMLIVIFAVILVDLYCKYIPLIIHNYFKGCGMFLIEFPFLLTHGNNFAWSFVVHRTMLERVSNCGLCVKF